MDINTFIDKLETVLECKDQGYIKCLEIVETMKTENDELKKENEEQQADRYVLEVLQFIIEKDGAHPVKSHIGYMKGKFKTKKDAVSYYDKHNPHMRSLNAHNSYISDWDPNTKLLYIVRDDSDLINATIDCF